MWNGRNHEVIQTSRVDTIELFEYIKYNKLYDIKVKKPSWTRDKRDAYRIVTAKKLRAFGVRVDTLDFRVRCDLLERVS